MRNPMAGSPTKPHNETADEASFPGSSMILHDDHRGNLHEKIYRKNPILAFDENSTHRVLKSNVMNDKHDRSNNEKSFTGGPKPDDLNKSLNLQLRTKLKLGNKFAKPNLDPGGSAVLQNPQNFTERKKPMVIDTHRCGLLRSFAGPSIMTKKTKIFYAPQMIFDLNAIFPEAQLKKKLTLGKGRLDVQRSLRKISPEVPKPDLQKENGKCKEVKSSDTSEYDFGNESDEG
jgi:hypothetical protein